jgi:hypothetical protein
MKKKVLLPISSLLLVASSAHAQFANGWFDKYQSYSATLATMSGWACYIGAPSQTSSRIKIRVYVGGDKDTAPPYNYYEFNAGTSERDDAKSACGNYSYVGWSGLAFPVPSGTPLYAYAISLDTGEFQQLGGSPIKP